MTAAPGVIDLHSHSTASDGQYPAAEVAARAAAAGVAVWALTDHDSVASLPQASQEAARHGIRFVPGIELSALIDKREIHVLGHFVDPDSRALKEFEDLLAEKRRTRTDDIIQKLRTLGVTLTAAEIEKFSGGKTLGRPHVARALVERGIVSDVREAFDRFLGEGKPAFVGRHRLTGEDAIALVRGAGGAATLAHPGVNKMERGDLERLKGWGLAGVEVFHPNHNPSLREKYLKIAAELGLIPTAGSDFHGEAIAPDRPIGTETMTPEAFARLEAARG
jgi:predicted metal-dependent phosphoesterase TrpH